MSPVLVSCFQLSILIWETSTSVLKNKNPNILCDGHPRVLLYSKKTAVNLMRRLTGINVLYVAYLKHEHCSPQYSVRHVFVSIN